MKKTLLSTLTATMLLISTPTLVSALPGDATEWTQIANNLELANQYAKQLQQYQVQLDSLKSMTQNIGPLDSASWAKFGDDFMAIKKITDATNGLTYTASDYESKFSNLHKGYDSFLNTQNFNPSEVYQKLSASTQSTISDNLKKLNLTQKEFEDDTATMEKLRELSSTQTGQLSAIQVASDIALHQTQTLKKLHQTMMMSANTQNQFMATQQTEKDAVKAYNETRRGKFDYKRPDDGSDRLTY